jgi:hypothetical protein
MPSRSLRHWQTHRSTQLNELEQAHRAIGGRRRGRRFATQQVNQAYAVLLSSQFQGFCRDLHSECIDHLVQVTPVAIRSILRAEFVLARKLDQGNPNPGNIGADFGRLGLRLWKDVEARDRRNTRRQAMLEALNAWRNAIAHQDFDPAKLGGRSTLQLEQILRWRRGMGALALAFDAVTHSHLLSVTGAAPW